MSQLLAIFRKELTDGVRDRRSLFSALLFPVSTAAVMWLLLTTIANLDRNVEQVEVPVVGAEHAPQLVGFLEETGLVIVEGPEDPKAAVQAGEALVLVIPEDFQERLREGRSVPLQMVRDRSRPEDAGTVRKVQGALNAWSGQLAALRLMARGVSPELVQPVVVSTVDLSTPSSKAAALVDVVTMFLVLACFFCNMYLAIDATAGERERNSLEALLLNPVRAEVLVFGKFLATVVFGAVGVGLTLVLMSVTTLFVPMEQLSMRIELGVAAPSVFLLLLPATLLAGAAQLLVASGSRSFKEAQIALSMVLFVPMLPGLLLSLNPTETPEWMLAVPVVGHQLMVTDLITGEGVEWHWIGLLTVSSLAVTGVLLLLCAWLYKREAILFAR
jgi:sodium transport system permease protein